MHHNNVLKDIGEPSLSNWTLVYITVSDGDDQNPAFSDQIYKLTVKEQASFKELTATSTQKNVEFSFKITQAQQGHISFDYFIAGLQHHWTTDEHDTTHPCV